MLITSESLKKYAGENLHQRKHKEGDRLEKSKFIIQCGKNEEKSIPGIVSFTAFCLSVSHFKEKPHQIDGEFTERGEIVSCICSCAAGLDGKCKHIMSVLKYLEKREEDLQILSCTDKKCQWKKSFQKAMENYEPAPLMLHGCFARKDENQNEIVDSQGNTPKNYSKDLNAKESEDLFSFACSLVPNSAVAKDKSRRHSMKTVQVKSKVTSSENNAFEIIFHLQESELMKKVQEFPCELPRECCMNTIQSLDRDVIEICRNTKNYYDSWLLERRKRITGSVCYGIYTYTKNKTPDWEKKTQSIFTPKDFKSEYTEYGKKTEDEARKVYIDCTKAIVVETGLIISKQNPWLAYSPDGVIFTNGKPSKLLEIKCPIIGKKGSIEETVQEQMKTFFSIETEGKLRLKGKHKYYGQVQLGMAVLNVKTTDFVVYSSFDKKVFILEVNRNETFIIKMLYALKEIYFSIMVHYLCLQGPKQVICADDNENIKM